MLLRPTREDVQNQVGERTGCEQRRSEREREERQQQCQHIDTPILGCGNVHRVPRMCDEGLQNASHPFAQVTVATRDERASC